ncbi:glutamate--tRNA ligase [Spiribacter salinus M19-40]|uniref:Glutamyl-Q tRNA(Asp) synthetase n=1 Tax=Spiribacter salinus M19-40 TaxID=1260251 RepID=R4V485_9GAMM|nr:tRNA glutamyl-Q(34) synthetase GluQRS [Spiribacter salinus]AGM40744.1 glutamate--tRNA ligase [Spiribacter salinus M19-40]
MTHNPVIGRFAPSPTGPLHFGSLIAAVASYVDARAAGGQWHLRIDDVDQTRCQPGAAADIQATLEAFGLHWDGPVQTQDGNRSRYQAVLETLIAAGRAYPCGCTRREVAAVGREGPAGMIYPGTCRAGLPSGREARSWRFRTEPGEWVIEDRHCPAITVNVYRDIGDFILLRGDGLHAYHLAMAIDDAELGVTDVVRGGDLRAATAPQVTLQHALGLSTPRYLHLPIALDARGRKLSKTNQAPAVDPTHPAPSLLAALTFLGQAPPSSLHQASPLEILDWATANWATHQIPAVTA